MVACGVSHPCLTFRPVAGHPGGRRAAGRRRRDPDLLLTLIQGRETTFNDQESDRRHVRQGLPFSKAVRAGDFVYVSGQVAFDAEGNLVQGGIPEAETRQVFRNIEAVLKEAGCTLADVVKVNNVWLDERANVRRFNKTYAEFFPTNPPAPLPPCGRS